MFGRLSAMFRYTVPFPAESDSFNAKPKAPAVQRSAVTPAGASGLALNEQMCHSSPVDE